MLSHLFVLPGKYELFFWLSDMLYHSKDKYVLILSDSLSSLSDLMYDHPILTQNLELHMELTRDVKEIVFSWVPGHVGIRGNSAADSAAKDALDGDISDELSPFWELETRVNKYLLQL